MDAVGYGTVLIIQKLLRELVSWLLLIWAVALLLSFVARTAIATTEQVAASEAFQTPGIDLEAYVPDQKDWSDKAKANYEKKKKWHQIP